MVSEPAKFQAGACAGGSGRLRLWYPAANGAKPTRGRCAHSSLDGSRPYQLKRPEKTKPLVSRPCSMLLLNIVWELRWRLYQCGLATLLVAGHPCLPLIGHSSRMYRSHTTASRSFPHVQTAPRERRHETPPPHRRMHACTASYGLDGAGTNGTVGWWRFGE